MRNALPRRVIGSILAIAIVAGGLATWNGTASGSPGMNRASVTCNKQHPFSTYWNRRQVDSIVAYNQPSSAHLHDFFGRSGNTVENGGVGSTMGAPIPLNAAHLDDPGYTPIATNCSFYGDWAAYWFPSPKFNGALITPGVETNTYQAPAGVQVATPPFGMTFVAGNASATSPDAHVAFTCGDIDVTYSAPTDCTSVPNGVVTAQVTFPDCWDGKTGYTYPPGGTSAQTYDTPTGLSPSHFSYSVNGACPPGQVPCTPGMRMAQLVTQQTFVDPRTNAAMVNPFNADGTLGLTFASGSYLTYHGDYINTWNMNYLTGIVNQCLNQGTPGSCPFGTQVGLHVLA